MWCNVIAQLFSHSISFCAGCCWFLVVKIVFFISLIRSSSIDGKIHTLTSISSNVQMDCLHVLRKHLRRDALIGCLLQTILDLFRSFAKYSQVLSSPSVAVHVAHRIHWISHPIQCRNRPIWMVFDVNWAVLSTTMLMTLLLNEDWLLVHTNWSDDVSLRLLWLVWLIDAWMTEWLAVALAVILSAVMATGFYGLQMNIDV